MPRGTPSLFYFLVLLSLTFIASQILMTLMLYTNDILDEIDIFQSLAPLGRRDGPSDTQCETGNCDTNKKTAPRQQYDEADGLCKEGYFHIKQDSTCHPLLTCKDFDDIIVTKQIGQGGVKQVYLATWKDHIVVYSNLTHPDVIKDFLHGADMLRKFHQSELVVQLIGYCDIIPAIITEYHSLGSLDNTNNILQQKASDNLMTRFRLCINYVRVIKYLHTSPIGTRVMCDSNDVHKTLSQFLVTSDLQIVINDLDALPLVDSSNGVLCGHKEIVGDFVAPEQLWPYEGKEFSQGDMPGYNEKTDIWKIPAIVDYLLGNDSHGDVVRFNLFKLHSLCRSADPKQRPSAAQVLEGYLEIKRSLQL